MKQKKIITNLVKSFARNPDYLIKELIFFYSKFTNGDKITKLLIIWLTQRYFFYLTYRRKKNFKKFIISKNSILLSAEKISNNSFELTKKKYFFSFISILIASFFKNWVLRGYSHDKKKIFLRFVSIITRFFLSRLPFEADENRKKKLIYILSNYLSKSQLKYLNLSLPDIFFSKQIKLLSKEDKNVKTSPHVFWDLDGYEKILLVKNKLCIHGFQHGGGYDLNKNLHKFNEIIMSDYFWSWGFGDLNIIQHRYRKVINKNLQKKYNRILWIERGNTPKIHKFFFSHLAHKETEDKKVINFIDNELQTIKNKVFRVPYLSRLSNLYQNSKIEVIDDKKEPELIIADDDLVIFDHIRHSLINFCLCRDIAFLCVMDLKKYSKLYDKNFINFLKSKNAIVNCSGKLMDHLLKNYNIRT